MIDGLTALGYRDVGWTVDGRDWAGGSPRRLEGRVVRGAVAVGDGAVVLLHGWPAATPVALPAIIDRLRDAGATFVRIDALPALPGRLAVPAAGARGAPAGVDRARARPMSDLLLAVDGGNSKTDVALLTGDGSVLASLRGPTVSHQAIGADAGAAELARLVGLARAAAGVPAGPADLGVLCLAGVDSAADVRVLAAAHGQTGLARELVLHNDTLAALRAGSPHPWGVAVIIGAGVNAVGLAPGGREVRFAGLGPISGDRGGGGWLGDGGAGSRGPGAGWPRTREPRWSGWCPRRSG